VWKCNGAEAGGQLLFSTQVSRCAIIAVFFDRAGVRVRKKVFLRNEPISDQAGVENSFLESQKRTQIAPRNKGLAKGPQKPVNNP
jgi:hypothetical protein